MYRLEHWTRADDVRLAVVPEDAIISGEVVEELNGRHTMSLKVSLSWKGADSITERDIIRLIGSSASASFRIKRLRKTKITPGTNMLSLFGEHIKYDMLSEICTSWKPLEDVAPSTAVSLILGNSVFSVGTISPESPISLTLHWRNVLDLLEEVRGQTGGDLVVNPDKTVSLISAGNTLDTCLSPPKNLLTLSNEVDISSLSNVILPFGGGEPPLDVAEAEHGITSISGATIQAETKVIPSDDSWNGYYLEITRGNDAGKRRQVLDTIDSSEKFVLSSSFTSVTVGDYFKVVADSSGSPIRYIRHADSISSYGTIERVFFYMNRLGIRNILKNGNLSGTYASGICDGWIEVGTYTPSANSDESYIRNGTKSQKCASASEGEGIKQQVSLSVGVLYSAFIWVYVQGSGSVKFEFYDGDEIIPVQDFKAVTSLNDTWIQLTIEGVEAKGSNGEIRILSNESNTTFYLDSALLEESAHLTEPNRYENISGARKLWRAAFDALISYATIRRTFEASIVDLYEADPDGFPYESIKIGDRVRILDDEIGLDSMVRVVRKERDLTSPYGVRLEFSNRRPRLSGVIARRFRRDELLLADIGVLIGRIPDANKQLDNAFSWTERTE